MGSSSSNKTKFEINGTLLAIECCLEADPQSCISCLLQHEEDMLSSEWQRSSSRVGWSPGGAGQEAACHELMQGCWDTALCGGYESCRRKAEGKGSYRKKRNSRMKENVRFITELF